MVEIAMADDFGLMDSGEMMLVFATLTMGVDFVDWVDVKRLMVLIENVGGSMMVVVLVDVDLYEEEVVDLYY